MSDWAHGYNLSQGYTYGVYRELAPDWLDMIAWFAGAVSPAEAGGDQRLRYLELGCGQGVGLALYAAARADMDFVGIDFSPGHIAHASDLAARAKLSNATFIEADFLDLAGCWPETLGAFDYVVLHGIYSWVPAEVREALVRCLARCVRPGGLVYMSYNSLPGWAATMPFQHVVQRLNASGGAVGPAAIEAGKTLFTELDAGGAALFKALPALRERIDGLGQKQNAYLVQEYLHRNWHPLWHSQVADALAGAKLEPIGSATLAENMLPQMLPEGLRAPIVAQRDRALQQDLIDCAINQSFRRDVYGRGRRTRLPGLAGGIEALMVHALREPGAGDVAIATAFGTYTVRLAQWQPIFAMLADGPVRMQALLAHIGTTMTQTVLMLAHGGLIAFGPDAPRDAGPAFTFNRAVAAGAAAGAPYAGLCAPVIGAMIPVRDLDLIVLDLWWAGERSAQGLGDALARRLSDLGRTMMHAGAPVSGDAARVLVQEAVHDILAVRLPLWRRMGALEA